MLESSKTATSTRPDWFQLTDLERLKKQYWICKGTNNFIKLDLPQSLGQRLVCWWRRVWSFPKLKTSQVLIVIYCSAEEAEAHSCIPSRYWQWDKRPASPCTLRETMCRARDLGCRGVAICGYVQGEWRTFKVFLAQEPLPDVDLLARSGHAHD